LSSFWGLIVIICPSCPDWNGERVVYVCGPQRLESTAKCPESSGTGFTGCF